MTMGQVSLLGRLGHPLRQPGYQQGLSRQQDFLLDSMEQWRTTAQLFLGAGQHLDHHPVRDFLHQRLIVKTQELINPKAGEVDDLVFVQAVGDRNEPQHSQKPESGDRNAAQQVIPVGKRVKVPTLVFAGQDGVDPAHQKLGQENRDKIKIIKKEVTVDGSIRLHQLRIEGGKKVAKTFRDEQPIED